jgi:putative autotransporter adhesin-like protein
MTSKRVQLALLAASLALAACSGIGLSQGSVTGSGHVTTETRALGGFTTIVLAGSGDATVVIGEPEQIVIAAEDNLLPYITTDVAFGRLTIGTRPLASLSPTRPLRYTVTVKHLEGIDLAGSGTVEVPQVSADWLKFEIHGSGDITAVGATDRLEAWLYGSGNIIARELLAQSARVEIPGSGQVMVWASDQLNATIKGSGTVNYFGQPNVIQDISGSGSVNGLGNN